MILYVVTETLEKYREGTVWFKHKHLFEKLSGDVCLILHYTKIARKLLEEFRPWAICHSGGGTDYKDYDVLQCRNYHRAITDYSAAQIGFCGGCQIMAVFFGSTIGPMRKLKPQEPDLSGYHPGSFKEWGVYPIRILQSDPLFRGCGRTIHAQEYHYWEVRKLSRQLMLLASSKNCRVQAFAHRHKPVYGVQFHPEAASKHYPDGLHILKNFFHIAREWRLKQSFLKRKN